MAEKHFDVQNVLDMLDCNDSDAGDTDSSSDDEDFSPMQVMKCTYTLIEMKYTYTLIAHCWICLLK